MFGEPADSSADSNIPIISVPEVRDFIRINAEIVGLLNLGHAHIKLMGVDGQRLIGAGLFGSCGQ